MLMLFSPYDAKNYAGIIDTGLSVIGVDMVDCSKPGQIILV